MVAAITLKLSLQVVKVEKNKSEIVFLIKKYSSCCKEFGMMTS